MSQSLQRALLSVWSTLVLLFWSSPATAIDTLSVRQKVVINKLAESCLKDFENLLNAIAWYKADSLSDPVEVDEFIDDFCAGNRGLFIGPDAVLQDNISKNTIPGIYTDMKVSTYLNDFALFYQRHAEDPIVLAPISFAEPMVSGSGIIWTKILYEADWPGTRWPKSQSYSKHKRLMYFIATPIAAGSWSVRIASDDFHDEQRGFRAYIPEPLTPRQASSPLGSGSPPVGSKPVDALRRTGVLRIGQAPDYERAVKSGLLAFDERRFAAAIDSFRTAMRIDPSAIEPLAFINKAQEELMISERLGHEKELWLTQLSVRSQRQRYLLVGGCSLFVFFAITVFLLSDRKRRQARFEKDAAQLETQALRSQMNPHFIFNALNSINAFVQKNDSDRASAYLSKFARLMRLVLENSRQAEVPLKDDLEALDLYLNLERARSRDASGGEKFDYAITVDPDIDQEETYVPPLVIQPFVENAIWHGMAGKETKGHILLSVTRRGDDLVMAIEDDGVGRLAKKAVSGEAPDTAVPGAARRHGSGDVKKTSLATTITKARLDLVQKQKGKPAGFRIIDLAQGTRVEVSLPISEAA